VPGTGTRPGGTFRGGRPPRAAVHFSAMSDRRALALFSLGLASALCMAALLARWVYGEAGAYDFLPWNLFLAWIPLLAAVAVYDAARRGTKPVRLLPLAAVWLLFLPNAPYLLTDFVHLGSRNDAPVWFDIVLFGSFAWTGVLLGFLSIFVMQGVVRRAYGALWSWILVGTSLAASSFGIYIGRSLRWNSWDFLVRPGALLEDIWARLADPLAYPRGVGMTLALTAVLWTGYLTLYAFAQLGATERVDAPQR
jgi:uncharacterized membrane protein